MPFSDVGIEILIPSDDARTSVFLLNVFSYIYFRVSTFIVNREAMPVMSTVCFAFGQRGVFKGFRNGLI